MVLDSYGRMNTMEDLLLEINAVVPCKEFRPTLEGNRRKLDVGRKFWVQFSTFLTYKLRINFVVNYILSSSITSQVLNK